MINSLGSLENFEIYKFNCLDSLDPNIYSLDFLLSKSESKMNVLEEGFFTHVNINS